MNDAPKRRPVVTVDEIRPELARIGRRHAILRGVSLGSLGLLTGCDLSTKSGIDAALWAMLSFNDRVQAALFSRNRLAQTFSVAQVTKPFRFNAYYEEWQVREPPEHWALELAGKVADKTPWTLDRLRALPQHEQITRHICIEGWSQIGHWSGPLLSDVLQRSGADLTAKYVGFTCFDDYSTSLDMPSALHPQTIVALDFLGEPLAPEWGAPARLRIPVKLGFKSAKNLQSISVGDTDPSGYWEKQGYDWFSGL
ncbi:MAG: molybdopterin-dependent oxidoreductase [Pseudomonadota bacterium]|nr:molybdopterin-dependent oxidoreductase [Pseudomonadota bacterium]